MLSMTRARTGVAVCLFAMTLPAQSPSTIASQAQRDIENKQYPRAETELAQALRTDPKNGSLWFSLGLVRTQLKKTDPAIDAFEKALPLSSEKAPVYFNLGLLYMERSDLAKAEQSYALGLALDPSNIPANQNDAFLLMQQGKFREAISPLERLKKITPDDVSVRATLIEAYLKTGFKDKGENEIDELLSSHLVTLQEGLALAKLLASHQEPDLAQRVFESLRNIWSDSPEVHGEFGLLLSEEGKFKEAVTELGQAVQLDPGSEKYSLGFSEALMSSEQYPVAFQFLLGAQKRFVNQPNFPYQLAITDISLQRFSDAIAVLDSLARERPDSGKVQFLLGGAYELSGELQTAEDHYRSAIRLVPQEPKYYRVLGSLLQKLGPEHLAESLQLLRKAVALDPTDADNKIVLARCLEKQGELDEAAALLEQAVVSEPSLRRAHSALAELYRRQQKLAQAEQEQSIAAKLEDEKITKEWDIWGPKSAGGP